MVKKKRWFRHAVKYYLAIKMNELLIHIIAWVYLLKLHWVKKNQYQNIILFTYHSPNDKINREEELISGCQGLGEGGVQSNC